MYDHRDLWKEVQRLQQELREVASRKGINSPEAIRAGQAFRNKMQEYSTTQ
jgi:hypothetical protein